jgi:hypothetical protein
VVENSFTGAVAGPADVGGYGCAGGYEEDCAVGRAEGGEGGLNDVLGVCFFLLCFRIVSSSFPLARATTYDAASKTHTPPRAR